MTSVQHPDLGEEMHLKMEIFFSEVLQKDVETKEGKLLHVTQKACGPSSPGLRGEVDDKAPVLRT